MNGYFDFNATAPLHPAARQAWLETADRFWHNPSSLYRPAGAARQLLEDCRERVAALLNCEAEEIIFCSGATEANNFIIKQSIERFERNPLISAIEHPSLMSPLENFAKQHYQSISVSRDGCLAINALDELLRADRPPLVSVMAANNETGVLQPWREALALCRERGIPFHCDAAQWIGRMPAEELGECDFLTASAHKFGGPKGVGFIKAPVSGKPFRSLRGGPQEDRRRAGTENLAGIAAMLASWEAQEAGVPALAAAALPLRVEFETAVRRAVPGIRIVAERAPRLWNTVLLLAPGPANNVKWLTRLSAKGFCVSTGSACSRGEGASEVLAAMGVASEDSGQALRISSGPQTTAADWQALTGAMTEVFQEISAAPAGLRKTL